jgi:hypothetical protein
MRRHQDKCRGADVWASPWESVGDALGCRVWVDTGEDPANAVSYYVRGGPDLTRDERLTVIHSECSRRGSLAGYATSVILMVQEEVDRVLAGESIEVINTEGVA